MFHHGTSSALNCSSTHPPSSLTAELRITSSSLRDTSSYGSGLQKFHLFWDVFSVPEADQLPASFPLLHSFVLWASTDPGALEHIVLPDIPFEPVTVFVAKKYLSAVQGWHIAQGCPPPLSGKDHNCINWSLQGLENLQGSHRCPIQPPITLNMLQALCVTLILDEPFEACIWAMVTCAFWGMMHFSEVSVS
jgi:hypothetical protein